MNKIMKTFKNVLNRYYYGMVSTAGDHRFICGCVNIVKKNLKKGDVIQANIWMRAALNYLGYMKKGLIS